ncbi:hypothetical protein [Clostridium sp. AM58-1XD]|uniref:hypothetical protein n=1 Tax=Clostridium sp. AM58-1XD TaxID=2292307 RepID=UPI000E54300B|nr:hypothetical protein [Clostridium sp. AM58-1XD]RGY98568.1 hypothetical protein DXA13_10835 [Clostridium sp. AM58-1XD]
MGDTYASLRKKYDGFMVPAGSILIGGKDVKDDWGCSVSDIKTSVGIGRPGEASFTVGGCYNVTNHSAESAVMDGLLPGSSVEIKLGYGSSLKTVFKGYADEVKAVLTQENGFVFQVTASDAGKLLQESGERIRILDCTGYSDAFSQIMAPYSGLCTSSSGEDDSNACLLHQWESDFEFIMRQLIDEVRPDWEFYISAGKACYEKHDSSQAEILELKPGAGLNSINITKKFLHRKIQITAMDKDHGAVTASQTAKGSRLDSSVSALTETIASDGMKTQEEATALAASWAARKAWESVSGTVKTTDGLPDMEIGKTLKIDDVVPGWNGLYYIRGVIHEMNSENGFTTTVELGG